MSFDSWLISLIALSQNNGTFRTLLWTPQVRGLECPNGSRPVSTQGGVFILWDMPRREKQHFKVQEALRIANAKMELSRAKHQEWRQSRRVWLVLLDWYARKARQSNCLVSGPILLICLSQRSSNFVTSCSVRVVRWAVVLWVEKEGVAPVVAASRATPRNLMELVHLVVAVLCGQFLWCFLWP